MFWAEDADIEGLGFRVGGLGFGVSGPRAWGSEFKCKLAKCAQDSGSRVLSGSPAHAL